MTEAFSTINILSVQVHGWQITRRRFRPTFKDRFIDLASVIPGLVGGPKTSFRERHVRLFPHLLSLDVVVPSGMYGVRRAECRGQPVSGPDLELLTRRLWHTRRATLCTELGDAEMDHWNRLGAHGLTLNVELISPHVGAQA